MTSVVTHFTLARPLDESLMNGIAAAHSQFGLQHVRLSPDMKEVIVTWDASRLTPAQVEASLHSAGIPAVRK